MTLYSTKITFTDGEIVMLRKALKNMLELCQEEIEKGEGAPYYAYRTAAQNVLDKLYEDRRQISGNNFMINFGADEEEE